MNCTYCRTFAVYRIDGANGTFHACDDHLTRAQRAAGVPRSTVRVAGGLLGGMGGGR